MNKSNLKNKAKQIGSGGYLGFRRSRTCAQSLLVSMRRCLDRSFKIIGVLASCRPRFGYWIQPFLQEVLEIVVRTFRTESREEAQGMLQVEKHSFSFFLFLSILSLFLVLDMWKWNHIWKGGGVMKVKVVARKNYILILVVTLSPLIFCCTKNSPRPQNSTPLGSLDTILSYLILNPIQIRKGALKRDWREERFALNRI